MNQKPVQLHWRNADNLCALTTWFLYQLSAPIVAHVTLPAVVARIFIVSPTVRVISVINRLLNITNSIVDNISLGRNGGQREQG